MADLTFILAWLCLFMGHPLLLMVAPPEPVGCVLLFYLFGSFIFLAARWASDSSPLPPLSPPPPRRVRRALEAAERKRSRSPRRHPPPPPPPQEQDAAWCCRGRLDISLPFRPQPNDKHWLHQPLPRTCPLPAGPDPSSTLIAFADPWTNRIVYKYRSWRIEEIPEEERLPGWDLPRCQKDLLVAPKLQVIRDLAAHAAAVEAEKQAPSLPATAAAQEAVLATHDRALPPTDGTELLQSRRAPQSPDGQPKTLVVTQATSTDENARDYRDVNWLDRLMGEDSFCRRPEWSVNPRVFAHAAKVSKRSARPKTSLRPVPEKNRDLLSTVSRMVAAVAAPYVDPANFSIVDVAPVAEQHPVAPSPAVSSSAAPADLPAPARKRPARKAFSLSSVLGSRVSKDTLVRKPKDTPAPGLLAGLAQYLAASAADAPAPQPEPVAGSPVLPPPSPPTGPAVQEPRPEDAAPAPAQEGPTRRLIARPRRGARTTASAAAPAPPAAAAAAAVLPPSEDTALSIEEVAALKPEQWGLTPAALAAWTPEDLNPAPSTTPSQLAPVLAGLAPRWIQTFAILRLQLQAFAFNASLAPSPLVLQRVVDAFSAVGDLVDRCVSQGQSSKTAGQVPGDVGSFSLALDFFRGTVYEGCEEEITMWVSGMGRETVVRWNKAMNDCKFVAKALKRG